MTSIQINFGEKFKIFRERLHLSQDDVAQKAHMHQTYLSNIESGKVQPKLSTKAKLIKAIGMTVEEFDDLRSGDNYDMPQPEDTVEVPLWAEIPCGPPTEIQEGYLGTTRILRHLAGKGRYVLRAEGWSMNKTISNGDLVLVFHKDGITLWEANKRVCTVLLNGEATCKRVMVEFDANNRPIGITLQPESQDPDCKPIKVDIEKDEFKITGIVLKVVDHDVV